MKKVKVISHRGAPCQAPEHSFEGYDLAIEQGTYNIEQDLQLSQDGILIVSHDRDLERMTGVPGVISELNAETIQAHHFSNGESVHQLAEVFDKYQKNIHYIIETKFQYAEAGDYRGEEAFIGVMNQYGVVGQVMFQSFVRESLAYLHQAFPKNETMLLVKKTKNYGIEHELQAVGYLDIICYEYNLLHETAIQKVKDAGKDVYIYFESGDDTPENLQRALSLGIDGVFTDYTDRAIEIIGKDNYC